MMSRDCSISSELIPGHDDVHNCIRKYALPVAGSRSPGHDHQGQEMVRMGMSNSCCRGALPVEQPGFPLTGKIRHRVR